MQPCQFRIAGVKPRISACGSALGFSAGLLAAALLAAAGGPAHVRALEVRVGTRAYGGAFHFQQDGSKRTLVLPELGSSICNVPRISIRESQMFHTPEIYAAGPEGICRLLLGKLGHQVL